MPCNDGSSSWGVVQHPTRHGLNIDDFEAVLCGIFTLLEDPDGANVRLADIDIDWAQVGVSRKAVEAWWAAHKKEDEARRAREKALKAADLAKLKADHDNKVLKVAALAKLTDDEKKALGL